jgi:hypothetical protein
MLHAILQSSEMAGTRWRQSHHPVVNPLPSHSSLAPLRFLLLLLMLLLLRGGGGGGGAAVSAQMQDT